MRDVSRRGLALSLVLSGVAGFVDAIGFIDTGGFFVSFMSGNSTQAGVEAFAHGIGAALTPLSLVAAFIVGVVIAAAMYRDGTRRAGVIAASAGLVALSALLAVAAPDSLARFWALAAAMGALNTLYLSDGRARVPITYATGTLVTLGVALAALITRSSTSGWQRPLLLWLALAGGAVAGAAAHGLGSVVALLGAAIVLALAAAVLTVSSRRRGNTP